MTMETITAAIKSKMSMAAGLNASVKFDLGAEGIIHADAAQSPPVISHEDKDADLTVITSAETLQAILDGRQDPNIAFMMGKLKVKGPMGLAMKLTAILED